MNEDDRPIYPEDETDLSANQMDALMSDAEPVKLIDRPVCEICHESFGGSHYHCGRCRGPETTSMIGHYTTFKDGTKGFYCDEANLGKTLPFSGGIVTEAMIRPADRSK